MPTINSANIEAASTGYRALFNMGFEQATTQHGPFCQEVPSTFTKEEYHLPSALGQMREWVGDRVIEDLARNAITMRNKTFEKTVAVTEEDFEDDNLGLYNDQFKALGVLAAAHPDVLFAEALEAGFTANGYDGVAFFSDAHPTSKSGVTWSNKTTKALDAEAFEKAYAELLSVKNDAGEPLDVMAFGGKVYLVVPPALQSAAEKIVNAQFLAGGETNTNFGKAVVMVNRRLTSDVKWYLIIGGGALKPFLKQIRRKPRLRSLSREDNETVFMKRKIVWGADGRWAVGRALPQFAHASTGVD